MNCNKLMKIDGTGEGKARIISIRAKLLEEAGINPKYLTRYFQLNILTN